MVINTTRMCYMPIADSIVTFLFCLHVDVKMRSFLLSET